MKRRTLLISGLIGAATVTLAGGGLLRLTRDPARARGQILRAIAPVLLEGAWTPPATGSIAALPPAAANDAPRAQLPATALDATLAAVDDAIAQLAPLTRTDLDRLFILLATAPGRRWLAGVSAPWDSASSEAIAAFLRAWRSHRSHALRGAYSALHDLVLASWYAQPAHWTAIGYPGPNASGPKTT